MELKPCPFCGGEAYFRTPIEKSTETIMMIECKRCGACPYSVSVSKCIDNDSKHKAIVELWNRRGCKSEAQEGRKTADIEDKIFQLRDQAEKYSDEGELSKAAENIQLAHWLRELTMRRKGWKNKF